MVRRTSDKKNGFMDNDQLLSGCRSGDKQCQRMLFKKYKDKYIKRAKGKEQLAEKIYDRCKELLK